MRVSARYRRKLVESQSAERNRLLKLLETANIKLASVASDVFGVSGRAMLKTLSEGNATAEDLAGLAKGRLRRKHDELVLALEGRVEEHHRFLLAIQLHRLEAAEHDIEALDSRIAERLEPYRTHISLDADPRRRLGGRRRFSLPRSVSISACSSLRAIWHPGLAVVPVTTRAQASRRAGAPARATSTSVPFW